MVRLQAAIAIKTAMCACISASICIVSQQLSGSCLTLHLRTKVSSIGAALNLRPVVNIFFKEIDASLSQADRISAAFRTKIKNPGRQIIAMQSRLSCACEPHLFFLVQPRSEVKKLGPLASLITQSPMPTSGNPSPPPKRKKAAARPTRVKSGKICDCIADLLDAQKMSHYQ